MFIKKFKKITKFVKFIKNNHHLLGIHGLCFQLSDLRGAQTHVQFDVGRLLCLQDHNFLIQRLKAWPAEESVIGSVHDGPMRFVKQHIGIGARIGTFTEKLITKLMKNHKIHKKSQTTINVENVMK